MAKEISLKNLNYVTVSLGLLLAAHSADAINWRNSERIFRPQGDDAVDTFVPVRYGGEENPLAIVKMPDIEADADILTAPAYQSLQDPIRQWLQRLGAGDAGGRSTRKISVAFVIHHRPSDFSVPLPWHLNASAEEPFTAAIKFLPLTDGRISFSLAADQRAGMRVQSLPNGFLLRQLPYNSRDDAWWRVTITENNPREAFTFATIIMLPNGDIIITVEAIPPAELAADGTDEIEELLRGMSHPDHSCLVPYEYDPSTAVDVLCRTVEDGNAVTLRRLLSNASDAQREELLKTDFEDGCTALHYAAQNGHTDVVGILLNHHALIDARDKDNWTTLHFAAQNGHTEVVRLLTAKGADVNAVTSDEYSQWTALHFATQAGHTAIVELLLDRGAKVDAMSSDENGNWTPLHLVVYRITAQDERPTIKAATKTARALLKKLQEQRIDIQKMLQNGVIKTYDEGVEFEEWLGLVRENDWYKQLLQEYDVDVTALAKNESGQTSLHIAAEVGHAKVATALLDKGALIDAQDKDGCTPLYIAASNGKSDVVRLFLDKKANVNAATFETHGQFIPLHTAAESGRVDAVNALLNDPVTPDQIRDQLDAQDKDGCTALYIAALNGREAIVRLLIERGADVNAVTSEEHGQWTPLCAAAENGHDAVVQALLDPEHVSLDQIATQLQARNKDGWTALHFAAYYGQADVIPLLLKAGANINTETSAENNSKTALHLAAENGHAAVVELLLNHHALIDARDEDNWTALHFAAQNGHAAVVELLLDRGAKVDAMSSDENGNWTPLHLVVYRQANAQDERPTIEAATATTRVLLGKLREQRIDIQKMLQNGVIKAYDEGVEFEEWLGLVQDPENAWYKDVLQKYGVNVDTLLAE